jgi:hypothetical protein
VHAALQKHLSTCKIPKPHKEKGFVQVKLPGPQINEVSRNQTLSSQRPSLCGRTSLSVIQEDGKGECASNGGSISGNNSVLKNLPSKVAAEFGFAKSKNSLPLGKPPGKPQVPRRRFSENLTSNEFVKIKDGAVLSNRNSSLAPLNKKDETLFTTGKEEFIAKFGKEESQKIFSQKSQKLAIGQQPTGSRQVLVQPEESMGIMPIKPIEHKNPEKFKRSRTDFDANPKNEIQKIIEQPFREFKRIRAVTKKEAETISKSKNSSDNRPRKYGVFGGMPNSPPDPKLAQMGLELDVFFQEKLEQNKAREKLTQSKPKEPLVQATDPIATINIGKATKTIGLDTNGLPFEPRQEPGQVPTVANNKGSDFFGVQNVQFSSIGGPNQSNPALGGLNSGGAALKKSNLSDDCISKNMELYGRSSNKQSDVVMKSFVGSANPKEDKLEIGIQSEDKNPIFFPRAEGKFVSSQVLKVMTPPSERFAGQANANFLSKIVTPKKGLSLQLGQSGVRQIIIPVPGSGNSDADANGKASSSGFDTKKVRS